MAEATTTDWTSGNPFLGQNNPYLQDIIDMSSRDMVDNYNRTVTPAQNAAAIRSGSFGNSALGELAQADQKNLQTSLGDLASKLRFNDYTQQQGMFQFQKQFDEGQRQFDQNFGRATFNDAFSQNQQNYQNGLGLLGFLQGTNQGDIGNTTSQQNTPLNYWQQFSNSANATGGGGGTQTSTQGTTSNPLISAIGGAQLGNSIYQNWGKNSGGGSSTPSYDSSGWNNWATYGSGGD